MIRLPILIFFNHQRGTITVNFGSAVMNTVTVRYDNLPGTTSNPASQSIAIGSVSFLQSTLPVSLTDFSGYRQDPDVLLKWATRQENNSAYFEIERNSGTGWEKTGTVAAAGFSYQPLHYLYQDINPRGRLLLYRLRQVDANDQFKYSNIVRLQAENAGKSLQTYPNPARDYIHAILFSPVQQAVTISLYDIKGRMIKKELKNILTGENNMMLSVPPNVALGIYQLSVTDAAGNLMGTNRLLIKQ